MIGPGRVSFDHVTAQIDNATITGHFGWGEEPKDHRRSLGAVLDAKGRIDFVQLKALAELLVGHNLTNAGALADNYSLQIAADAFAYQDLTVKGIQVNAKYGNDALNVTKLQVDDIGGAKIERTNGEIDNLSGNPRGHLDVMLDAPKLTGLAQLADRFLPESGFARWLHYRRAGAGQAVIERQDHGAAARGGSGFAFTSKRRRRLDTFNLSAGFTGGLAHWRSKPAEIKATLDSPDSVGLARQFGLAAVTLAKDNGAHVRSRPRAFRPMGSNGGGRGFRRPGRQCPRQADVGEIWRRLSPARSAPERTNRSDRRHGRARYSRRGRRALRCARQGQLSVSGDGLDLNWKNGTIGPAIASGDVTLAPDGAGGWHIGGNVVADTVDLGWIAALGLGFAPLPTGDPAEPWSRMPFSAPAYGRVSGKLQVAADRLDVGDLGLTGTAFTLALQPQRIDLDLTEGQLAGGTVTGGMSIHNVGGNVDLSGRFDLKGAALESFVWRRDGRSVATGVLDLSANFEATGRSPAGLVSTMTGGGVITVRDGLARYVNPNTVRQIVRASDLGQQFSEDALRAAFGERIDADNLSFKQASGAFAIVAGAVRLKNLMVKADGLAAKGNAVIDFNTMMLDSDWNLAFNPVDNKVQGTEPKAGIVFHGPIAAPSRSIDVLPFAAYLNEREAARMNEIIALDAATRAEKERLSRLVDKLKADAVQRPRISASRPSARRGALRRRRRRRPRSKPFTSTAKSSSRSAMSRP